LVPDGRRHRRVAGRRGAARDRALGALTTYSTFSFETWRLIEEECYGAAVANVLLSVLAGLAAVAIGYAASAALIA
jgi:fluoride ion exporter CrcB/FEX